MTKSSTTLCRQPWSRRRLGGRKIEKEAASVTKGLLSVSGGLWSRLGLSAVETWFEFLNAIGPRFDLVVKRGRKQFDTEACLK